MNGNDLLIVVAVGELIGLGHNLNSSFWPLPERLHLIPTDIPRIGSREP